MGQEKKEGAARQYSAKAQRPGMLRTQIKFYKSIVRYSHGDPWAEPGESLWPTSPLG